MTEPTDKPLDDQQLDEYLKGDSSVSRHYRQLPGEEVPALLDRRVLREAEDAVKRPSRPVWMSWAKPLAVAASAVLVVSIAIETGLKDETLVTSQTVQAPAAARRAEESGAAPAAPTSEVKVPPPVVYVEPAKSPTFADAMSIDVPEPAPTAAPAPEMSARFKQPVVSETADAEIQQDLAKAEQEDKASLAADELRQKSAGEQAAREQVPIAAQRRAEPAAVVSYSRPLSSNANSMATLQKTYTDPEAWLKDIRQLREDNKQDEADREWRRFREAFPDYAVPETDSARAATK